jgi:hypothetical protein
MLQEWDDMQNHLFYQFNHPIDREWSNVRHLAQSLVLVRLYLRQT